MSEKQSIPEDTKVIPDKKYKFIMLGSFVLYYFPDHNLLYPCKVTAFSHRYLIPNLTCERFNKIDAEWERIFPIEAYRLVKDRAHVYGFGENEEVTVDKLRQRIERLGRKFFME